MTTLSQALRYPWQGGLARLLPLVFLQLIPVIGQIILVGYGQAIAHTIYNQQDDLPQLQLGQAFLDGLRLVAVGTVYCLPVFLMVLMAVGVGSLPEGQTAVSAPPSSSPSSC